MTVDQFKEETHISAPSSSAAAAAGRQIKYTDQLFELADKDEWSENHSWPPLKDEIKALLKETFSKWPSSSSPILHPAATLIPLNSSNIDDLSTSTSSSFNSLSNGNGKSNGNHPPLSSSNQRNTQTTYSAELNNRFMHGNSENGANDDGIEANGLDQDISIKESDMQAFFPSKRQAPVEWKGSWGKRIDTQDELDREQAAIFGMLDDFENQPPFTIQRLAELVIKPTQYHHTLPKYISALKRVLAVTATRDAFPAHAGEEDEEALSDELSAHEIGMDVTNGISGVTSRSRKATPVPNSPITAPLFSPIPFLMKSGDEGMPGAGPRQGEEDSSVGEGNVVAMVVDRDVPTMELAGADRTTEEAADQARRSGKGVGSNRSVADGANEIAAEIEENDAQHQTQDLSNTSIESNSAQNSNKSVEIVQKATPAQTNALTQEVADVGRAGELSSSTPSTSSATNSEPLGVPVGPVDEVDQIGERHGQLTPLEPGSIAGGAKAFSSTTTTAPDAKTTSTNEERIADENEEGRALKRVKSDRQLGEGRSEKEDEK